MLCILDLVSTEQITHCEMVVIWPRRNIVEIITMEGCRVKITVETRSILGLIGGAYLQPTATRI